MIHVTANAKLNLSLEIIGRRDDGFHELVSVMQAINLADELVALPAPDGSVSLECNDPALADSSDNTVLTRRASCLRKRRAWSKARGCCYASPSPSRRVLAEAARTARLRWLLLRVCGM